MLEILVITSVFCTQFELKCFTIRYRQIYGKIRTHIDLHIVSQWLVFSEQMIEGKFCLDCIQKHTSGGSWTICAQAFTIDITEYLGFLQHELNYVVCKVSVTTSCCAFQHRAPK